MTYAPKILLDMRDYLVDELGAPASGVGIVGDSAHRGGYHLGLDRLLQGKGWQDFSARRPRDVSALRGRTKDAAAALDITTKVRDHRAWLTALLADFKLGKDYTEDIRAINGTLDGRTAWRWDREHGFKPTRTDNSHLWHSHVEWYRDAIAASRPQLIVLRRFYAPGRSLRRKATGATAISVKARGTAGRWTWAQLVEQLYLKPPKGAELREAGEALRRANADRPRTQDGSGVWETVGAGRPITVPAQLYY